MSDERKILIEIGPDLLKAIKETLKANKEWNDMIVRYSLTSPEFQSPARAIRLAFGIDINKYVKLLTGG